MTRTGTIALLLTSLMGGGAGACFGQATLLNVSYDPTREFYQDFNAAFARYWKAKTGADVVVNQSHGGSGKQARAVIDGLPADVVTLALAYDIDAIAERGALLPANWQSRLAEQQRALHLHHRVSGSQGKSQAHQGLGRLGPAGRCGHHAKPEDLGRRALELPGGLGLRAEAQRQGTRPRPKTFVARLFKNVPVLDSGARGATTSFVQRGIGDVLLAWENEAFLAINELGKDKFELVAPSISILAEPTVAVVDKVANRHRHGGARQGLLEYLYSAEGQEIAAQTLLPAAAEGSGAKYQSRFSRHDAVHHRRGIRRLAEGAEEALRRRRRVRPDLSTGKLR